MSAPLVLRLAARELRGARHHFTHFLACVTLGVAAIVAVASFAASLQNTVAASARTLLGGDLEINSTRPLSAAALDILGHLERDGARAARVIELAAMASAAPGGTAALVEIKAVDGRYPLYGGLALDPARPLADLLGQGRALVHDSLAERLGLRVGEPFMLGGASFVVAGRILAEPDRSPGLFTLGPRVLISASDLGRTDLLQPGSRVRYRTLLRLVEGADPEELRQALSQQLPDGALRLVTFAEAQPGLRRLWDQLTTYLGLAGLVTLLIGGIGVAVSVRVFVREKLPTIAILKCLGAGWREVFLTHLILAGWLGLLGSLAGAALGSALQWVLEPVLAPLMAMPVIYSVSPPAIARGLAMGLGVTVLFASWPLLEIRRVLPAIILRRESGATLRGRGPWLAAIPVVLGLAGLALWQAGSWKVGAWFIGGTIAGTGLLYAGSRLVVSMSRRLPRGGSIAWRQAIASLHRPESQAGPVLLSLGLAVMLVVSVALLERSLGAQISARAAGQAPALFFVDVQPDQAERFALLVAGISGSAPELIPAVRSRLAAIDGVPIPPSAGRRPEEWYLSREYVLTWAARPPVRNTIVRGRWWTPEEAAGEALISVEEDIARHLGVDLGDTLTFDVQGVPVAGRITSIRHVDWRSLHANFFVIFSPGALEDAPGTYIATASMPPGGEGRLQSAVVAAFPNVSAIPVREILERAGRTMDQMALAIRLMAAFAIVAGVVVLAGALSLTRRQRLYESVILKVLGATRGLVAHAFALEYALLGAAAGIGGTLLACLLAWAVLRWVLDMPWTWHPVALVLGILLSALLSVAVGFLTTFRILGQRPLPILREE